MEEEHTPNSHVSPGTPDTANTIKTNDSSKRVSFWQKTKIVIASFLTFIVILLLLLNWYEIHIDMFFKSILIPFPIAVIVTFFIGYLWGTFAMHRKSKRRQKKTISKI